MPERVETDRTLLLVAAGLGAIITFALVLQDAPRGTTVTIALAVALLAVFNRRVALYLLVPAIALSPEIPIGGLPLRIEDLLMVPLIVGWASRLLVSKGRHGTALDRLLVAYFLAGLVATIWGGYVGTADLFTTDKLYSAPFHLLKRLEFVLLVFVLTDTLTTVAEVRSLTYVLMASLAALSAFALSQFLSNQVLALAPAGAPVHEPGLASMLNVALALSLIPALSGRRKFLLGGLFLFSVGVLPLALGRNFIAATALVTLYVGLFQQRWLIALVPLPWLVGEYIYPPHVIERVLSFRGVFEPDITGVRTQGASLLSRIISPGNYSIQTLDSSPLVGLGLASRALGEIDSEYATQFVYTGLLGLVIFLLLGARLIRLTRQARMAAKDPLDAALARGFQLALVSYAIFSIFSPSISATRGGGLFFVIISLLAILHRCLTQSSPETPSGDGRQASSVGA